MLQILVRTIIIIKIIYFYFFLEEEKEHLEQDKIIDSKNEKIIANLNDITGKNQENMETPTPNPDDFNENPPKNEKNSQSPKHEKLDEKERAKEEIVKKIENEANKNPITNSKVNDPNIKKKLEGEIDGEKEKNDSKDNISKKDKKLVKIEQETPTPNNNHEEDKVPLMKEKEPVKPQMKENNEIKEKVEAKEAAPMGINLGISLRIPEKEKNEKKGKEECNNFFILFNFWVF